MPPSHLVADFYARLFNAVALEGKDLPGGNAYYFPTDGDVVLSDYLSKIAEALHEFGAVKTAEPTQYTSEELAKARISCCLFRGL